MAKRLTLVIALGLAMATSVLAVKIPTAGSEEETKGLQAFSLSEAKAFAEFPLYHVGAAHEGYGLNRIYRVDAKPLPAEPIRRNDVTFIYGSCEATAQMGCRPPLQVQVWHVCQRHRGMYPFPPEQELTIRGVPAALYEDGRRLELYSDRVTVVLFGHDELTLRTAATRLRGVNNAVSVTASLPPPAAAAVRDQLCS